MNITIRKNYRNVIDKLANTYGGANIRFDYLSETSPASASLRIEHADQRVKDSKKLEMTFGQNSVSGSSVHDMRARVKVYEQAIEYGELLKASLKAQGYTFVCDEKEGN